MDGWDSLSLCYGPSSCGWTVAGAHHHLQCNRHDKDGAPRAVSPGLTRGHPGPPRPRGVPPGPRGTTSGHTGHPPGSPRVTRAHKAPEATTGRPGVPLGVLLMALDAMYLLQGARQAVCPPDRAGRSGRRRPICKGGVHTSYRETTEICSL